MSVAATIPASIVTFTLAAVSIAAALIATAIFDAVPMRVVTALASTFMVVALFIAFRSAALTVPGLTVQRLDVKDYSCLETNF